MEPTIGLEPMTSSLPRKCSTAELRGRRRTPDPRLAPAAGQRRNLGSCGSLLCVSCPFCTPTPCRRVTCDGSEVDREFWHLGLFLSSPRASNSSTRSGRQAGPKARSGKNAPVRRANAPQPAAGTRLWGGSRAGPRRRRPAAKRRAGRRRARPTTRTASRRGRSAGRRAGT